MKVKTILHGREALWKDDRPRKGLLSQRVYPKCKKNAESSRQMMLDRQEEGNKGDVKGCFKIDLKECGLCEAA